MAQSLLSSTIQSIANYFKPHRAEALQRIRINAFGFVLIVVFSNLLPLPSLQSAICFLTISNSSHERAYRWFCILGTLPDERTYPKLTLNIKCTEVLAATIFAFNVLEGAYAVKYPKPPLPPYASPAKTKPIFKSGPTPKKRAFKVLSPNVRIFLVRLMSLYLLAHDVKCIQTSPQPQKPFSPSPSFTTSISAGSTYPTSPLSTPSRVIHYSNLGGSTNTQSSTTTFQTPSPVMSAYRGKHLNSVGREFHFFTFFVVTL